MNSHTLGLALLGLLLPLPFACAQDAVPPVSAPGFEGFDGAIEVLVTESEARNDSNVQITSPVDLAPPIAKPIARIQALDKVTARLTEIDIPVGGTAMFGTISVNVESCLANPPDQLLENRAFMRITDQPVNSQSWEVFTGWMFSSSPALNAMEHPIFDVWVVACLTQKETGAEAENP